MIINTTQWLPPKGYENTEDEHNPCVLVSLHNSQLHLQTWLRLHEAPDRKAVTLDLLP